MSDFDYKLAEQKAEKVITEAGIVAFPIDPTEIASRSDILVQAMPEEVDDFSGALVRKNNKFGILYSTSVDNEGRKRFNIAHELGHYHLSDHPRKLGLLDNGMHQSRADFRSINPIEREADAFASGLLMPKKLTAEFLRGRTDVGLEVVKALRNSAQASLTAAALRYVNVCEHAAAVVVSSGGAIEYCFASGELRDRFTTFIKSGTLVPKYTATQLMPALKKSEHDGQSTWDAWFGTGGDADVYEQVIALGGTGKLLTVLTLDEDG